jgi:hypothetical protein
MFCKNQKNREDKAKEGAEKKKQERGKTEEEQRRVSQIVINPKSLDLIHEDEITFDISFHLICCTNQPNRKNFR